VNRIEEALRGWLEGAERIVVVGVGSEMRRDDFVGVVAIRGLRCRVDEEHVMLVESEIIPESFLGDIEKFEPSHVLIVDAGLVGLVAGGVKFMEASELLKQSAVSTHALSLRVFCEFLEETVGCRVGLLVVQPERTDFGEGLSSKVARTAKELETLLFKVFGESNALLRREK